ncbi:MAG: type II secretion system protein [Candidatus Giovannonibacteria bacterium]|nr:type II secretion system protein [Candidatus Giovannonibacteria bacterium]
MRGYTLLETVIYVSILAVIAVLALGSILSVYKAFGKTKVERRLALNGDVAMERMLRDIRSATSTDIAVSAFKTNPGILKIGWTKFSLLGSVLRVTESGQAADLTSDINVTNLMFYRTVSANSEIIKIEMTLQAGTGIFQKSKNFYGSAVLRGIYQ